MTKGERFIRCKGKRHGSRGSRFIMCRGQRHGSRRIMSDMNSVLHQSVAINAKGDMVDYLDWLSMMQPLKKVL
jgi:hypothetical protein